jgi:hypothetical protein
VRAFVCAARANGVCESFCAEFDVFNGLALHVAGLDHATSTINICLTCHNALANRRRPHLALANGLEIGEVPPVLSALTWAEQRLIALYRVTIDLVYFSNEDKPGDMERQTFHHQPRVFTKDKAGKVKGRCFCVPQDALAVNAVLPPDPDTLKNTVRVIFLGAKEPRPEDIDMQYALTVDRNKVAVALNWLVANNHLYKRLFEAKLLQISKENLAKYPDKPAVPAVIRDDAIRRAVSSAKLTKDSSGYTHADGAADITTVSSTAPDTQGSTWSHNGLLDVNGSGLGPDAVQQLLDRRDDQQAPPPVLRDVNTGHQTDKVVLMRSGSRVFMLDHGHPDVDHGAFPTLFPFGVGGPTQPGRVCIGAPKYIEHLMHLHDRRFATHPPFVFTMFNLLQRQRVSWGAKRQLEAGYFMDFSKELPNLSATAIAELVKELRDRDERGLPSNLNSCKLTKNKQTAKAISRMFTQISSIGGQNLPRTAASKRMARLEALGMYVKLGLPDFFVTITPDDHNSPLVINFHGKQRLSLKLTDPDLPDNVPGTAERLRVWCNDPFAAAQFASIVMNAFISALLGFDREVPAGQMQKRGVIGDVRAYDFIDEEQNRGTLHWHGMVWLAHKPDYDSFVELLQTKNFRDRVLSYLSAVIRNEPVALWDPSELRVPEHLPEGIELTRRACDLAGCNGDVHDFVVGTATVQQRPGDAADNHISLHR